MRCSVRGLTERWKSRYKLNKGNSTELLSRTLCECIRKDSHVHRPQARGPYNDLADASVVSCPFRHPRSRTPQRLICNTNRPKTQPLNSDHGSTASQPAKTVSCITVSGSNGSLRRTSVSNVRSQPVVDGQIYTTILASCHAMHRVSADSAFDGIAFFLQQGRSNGTAAALASNVNKVLDIVLSILGITSRCGPRLGTREVAASSTSDMYKRHPAS